MTPGRPTTTSGSPRPDRGRRPDSSQDEEQAATTGPLLHEPERRQVAATEPAPLRARQRPQAYSGPKRCPGTADQKASCRPPPGMRRRSKLRRAGSAEDRTESEGSRSQPHPLVHRPPVLNRSLAREKRPRAPERRRQPPPVALLPPRPRPEPDQIVRSRRLGGHRPVEDSRCRNHWFPKRPKCPKHEPVTSRRRRCWRWRHR